MVSTPDGLLPTPQPSANAFDRLRVYSQALRRWLPQTPPVDYDTFVEYYKGRRKAVYRAAADSLLTKPVSRQDAELKAFVKAEKLNLTNKPDPAPRLIQPRTPRYNVEVGRYLRPIEKLVYRAIAKTWKGPTVFKGMNAAQQGQEFDNIWNQFARPVAIGLDASRFDQHVSKPALKWEHSVYKMCYKGAEGDFLQRLLSWQLDNRGKAYTEEGVVSYEVSGCRMSGDMNTSMGNCLIMCALVWLYCLEKGIVARLANNGDDCVVVMDQRDEALFSEGLNTWFLEFGFEMVVEAPVYVLEEIVFCQTQPVYTPSGYVMVRSPDAASAKDCSSLLPLNNCFTAWAGAIGACGLSLTGGIPFFQEFYSSLLAAGTASKIKEAEGEALIGYGMRMLSQGMARKYVEIDPRTRMSFALAFGMMPDEQEELERWLRCHPISPQVKMINTKIINLWYK